MRCTDARAWAGLTVNLTQMLAVQPVEEPPMHPPESWAFSRRLRTPY